MNIGRLKETRSETLDLSDGTRETKKMWIFFFFQFGNLQCEKNKSRTGLGSSTCSPIRTTFFCVQLDGFCLGEESRGLRMEPGPVRAPQGTRWRGWIETRGPSLEVVGVADRCAWTLHHPQLH